MIKGVIKLILHEFRSLFRRRMTTRCDCGDPRRNTGAAAPDTGRDTERLMLGGSVPLRVLRLKRGPVNMLLCLAESEGSTYRYSLLILVY